MLKKPTKRRRKPPANPSAFTINRALLPYMRAPVADWEKISRRLWRTQSRASTNAGYDAQNFALVSAYLSARNMGASHEAAGKHAYAILVKVRRALGYTYPKGTNPFRYA